MSKTCYTNGRIFPGEEAFSIARPRKCRRVCCFPQALGFVPVGTDPAPQRVTLTVDEYETIRLIDREGLSQEACGQRMEIARTTVQQLYASARRKLAEMLVLGAPLEIAGGDYRLCDGTETPDCCRDCFKRRFIRQNIMPKGECRMRIAVTHENGQIFQHFGHTEQFKLYDVEDGKVVSSQILDTNGTGHGALAELLRAGQVDTLICGGIGGGARAALDAAGIQLYGGASGGADQAVEALLAGTLAYDPNVMCSHHGEGHHEGGDHHCGEHSCGEPHCTQ